MSALAEVVFAAGLLAGLAVGSALVVYALIYAVGERERTRCDHRYAEGP